jgi:putative membrane protein
MADLFIKVVINAAALLVAAVIVPEFKLVFSTNKPEDWIKIGLIALVFAIVNSYLKPILKFLAMPIGFLTMGLVAFAINAAMLLGTAWVVWQLETTAKLGLHIGFQLGTYPPTWSYEAIGVAVVASIVISIVATALEILLVPRKVLGF